MTTESAPGSASARPPALGIRNLSFAYRDRLVLDDVSLAVAHGRFTALLGPNGAGKTTLFSLVTRLLAARNGTISIAGLDLRGAGAQALRPLGIVFQQPTLDLDLTVRQNLRYSTSLRGLPRAEAARRIERELARFGLEGRAPERVRNLNGGHRRRVEIARALLHDPELLLLDEPTVGLDPASRTALVEHAHALAAERGIGVLWATHLIDEIRPGDDLVILHRGRIVERGTAADVVTRSRQPSLEAAFSRLTASEAAPA